MNIIDKKFNELISKFKKMSEKEIFINIKNSFLSIPTENQKAISDFLNQFNYWGTIDISNNNFSALKMKAKTLKNNTKEFKKLYKLFNDYKSKKLLYAILNHWYSFDFNTLNSCLNNPYKQYFDLDIIPKCQNEIIVDLGSYIGDTVLDYLYTYGPNSYKKIYCYEITPDSFAYLKNNLAPYNNIIFKQKAIINQKENLYLSINNISNSANQTSSKGKTKIKATTLDLDIKDKISLIKMDIEGDELKALFGSKKHIINDTPKLLISVYHKNNHLWQIPLLINSYNNNYNYYLRCYGNYLYPTEIVFFAIPNKKSN